MATTTKLKTLRDALSAVPPGVRIEVRTVGGDGTMNGEIEHVGEDHFILGSGVTDEPYDHGWHLNFAHVIGFRRESDEPPAASEKKSGAK